MKGWSSTTKSTSSTCAGSTTRRRGSRLRAAAGSARSGSSGAPAVALLRTAAPLPAAAFLAALLAAALHGCADRSPDARDARQAAGRYLAALAGNDHAALRAGSTCILASGSIVGGSILRAEPIRPVARGALDSLAHAADRGHADAETAWSAATEADADSLFERSRMLARRSTMYRNAVRAVALSTGGASLDPGATIRTCRMRIRVRWGGPLVGPGPVDREHVLRALAAPGGPWIVFSVYPREDDPRPEPI